MGREIDMEGVRDLGKEEIEEWGREIRLCIS